MSRLAKLKELMEQAALLKRGEQFKPSRMEAPEGIQDRILQMNQQEAMSRQSPFTPEGQPVNMYESTGHQTMGLPEDIQQQGFVEQFGQPMPSGGGDLSVQELEDLLKRLGL